MNKFLIKFSLFLVPLFIIILVPFIVLFISRENFHSIDNVLKQNKKYLIGYAYNQENYRYLKWKNLNFQNNQVVIALGSSRVLQFREQMFDSSFYNAGYSVSSLNEFIPFLQSIPKPEYLIIGLDQWMFNENYDNLKKMVSNSKWEMSYSFFPEPAIILSVYKDLFFEKYTFEELNRDSLFLKIGLDALVNGKGFRNDGSIDYGVQISKLMNNDPTANDYGFLNTHERIKRGEGRFRFGNSVNVVALEKLNDILLYCSNHGIYVIGFMPPFADEVYEAIKVSGKYNYVKDVYKNAKPLFDKFDFELYDFNTVSSCGSADSETIDGFHGGEVTYQRIMIKILESGSKLGLVADLERLKKDLANKKNNYSVYY